MTIDSKKISNKTLNKLYDAEIHNGNKVQPAFLVLSFFPCSLAFWSFLAAAAIDNEWRMCVCILRRQMQSRSRSHKI